MSSFLIMSAALFGISFLFASGYLVYDLNLRSQKIIDRINAQEKYGDKNNIENELEKFSEKRKSIIVSSSNKTANITNKSAETSELFKGENVSNNNK